MVRVFPPRLIETHMCPNITQDHTYIATLPNTEEVNALPPMFVYGSLSTTTLLNVITGWAYFPNSRDFHPELWVFFSLHRHLLCFHEPFSPSFLPNNAQFSALSDIG